MNSIRICTKCVLPEVFPGISFNDQGICSFCQSGERSNERESLDSEKKFLDTLDQVRGKSIFDCVVAYSGGKDSSYLLDLLVTQYNLKALAVTLDNWFLSDQAFANMRTVTRSLNVSHLLIRPPYGMMKGLYREASRKELYSRKSLERASTICTTCISFVRFSCFRTAIEKEIPLVIFGFNPGQIPEGAAIIKTNAALLGSLQKAIYGPISSIAGDAALAFFLEERHLASTNRFPYLANPFAFVDYQEEKVYSRIRQIGWQRVSDTDENSTNCLLNSYANVIHYDKYGYHPYALEIANMVRKGKINRDEGLRRLKPPSRNPLVSKIARDLSE